MKIALVALVVALVLCAFAFAITIPAVHAEDSPTPPAPSENPPYTPPYVPRFHWGFAVPFRCWKR